jgi:hypothetical protein
MKKRVLLIAAGLLLLLAGGGAILGWLAVRQITPERLVREIEASRNCRAKIDACQLELFSSPAKLELTGVTLVPRDTEADQATPLGTRPAIELHTTYFRFGSGTLEVDLVDLVFRRRLTVRQFVVRNADVKCDLLPNGDNTLKQLFDSPKVIGGKPAAPPLIVAPAAVAAATTNTVTDAAQAAVKKPTDGDDEAATSSRAFNVRDFAIPSTIQRIALEDSRLRFRNRKSRAVTEFNGCSVSLTDIAVDPRNLAASNRATLDLRTRLFVDGREKKSKEMFRYTELVIRIQGRITPFEPGGSLNPDMVLEATLGQGSMVQRLPVLQKLQKSIDRAQQAGLKLEDLDARATLERDATFNLHLHDNRMDLTQNTDLLFTDYTLSLQPGSFIDASEETHEFRAMWSASQRISDQALNRANEFLASLGPDAAKELRRLFITPMVKDGRVALTFISSGDLDEPKVKVNNPIGDWKDQLKEAKKSLLEGVQGAFSGTEPDNPRREKDPDRKKTREKNQ